jgi:hypothetical protein
MNILVKWAGFFVTNYRVISATIHVNACILSYREIMCTVMILILFGLASRVVRLWRCVVVESKLVMFGLLSGIRCICRLNKIWMYQWSIEWNVYEPHQSKFLVVHHTQSNRGQVVGLCPQSSALDAIYFLYIEWPYQYSMRSKFFHVNKWYKT